MNERIADEFYVDREIEWMAETLRGEIRSATSQPRQEVKTEAAPQRTKAQLINQDSGNKEWYTPGWIVDGVRRVYGGKIDLDPASSEIANKTIRAETFFTKDDDGLSLDWFGNVWMNHPFGIKSNRDWVGKAMHELDRGNVKNLICVSYASTSEGYYQPLFDGYQCNLQGRLRYIRPDGTEGKRPSKGSTLTFFGSKLHLRRFILTFSPYGRITKAIA